MPDMNNTVSIILPGAVVAGAALLVFLVDMIVSRKEVLAWIAAAGLVAAAAVATGQWLDLDGGSLADFLNGRGSALFAGRGPESGFGAMVRLDKYAFFATLLFCGVGVLTIMLSDAYMKKRREAMGEFYGLLLLIIAGMIGMAVSIDVIALFVAFELMSLPTYVLAGFLRGDEHSGEAAIKYFVNGAFAAAVLLFGLALLYAATGQTNYASIAASLGNLGPDAISGLTVVAMVFVVVGFGFKVSAVPFHGWAPDVYEGAPTPVTAFMSVGVKAGAFIGFLKLFTLATPDLGDIWTAALMVLAVLTMVVGNALALPQRNLKRMLAYSSIAHAGYLLLGLIAAGVSGASAGSSAVLFYLGAYSFMNLGAFGVLIWIRDRRRFRYGLDEMAGLGRSMPWAAIAMTLFMVSLTGIPPTIGFWGKFYLFTAVVDADLTWLAIVAVIMSSVSAYYYLRVVWYMYFREAPEDATVEADEAGPALGAGAAVALAALGVIALGLYPSPLISAAQGALRLLLGG
jgi:NADH-quinone oxidoreductase subunit N